MVFEILGVIIGAFLSGLISDRLTFRIEKNPKVRSHTRLIFAFMGGLLFAAGAQFARGCTSGAALSGMAVLATSSFITMIAFFGTGFCAASIGKIDALVFVAGLFIGVFDFGETFPFLKNFYNSSDLGILFIYDSLSRSRGLFAFLLIFMAVMAFFVTYFIETKITRNNPCQVQ